MKLFRKELKTIMSYLSKECTQEDNGNLVRGSSVLNSKDFSMEEMDSCTVNSFKISIVTISFCAKSLMG